MSNIIDIAYVAISLQSVYTESTSFDDFQFLAYKMNRRCGIGLMIASIRI